MEIRILNAQDAQCYRRVRLEALKKSPESFSSSYEEAKNRSIEDFEERLTGENSYTFGAFEEGELVGIITLIIESTFKLKHRANIVAMFVSPQKRGLGIGRALLEEAINKAKTIQRVEQIYLSVVSTNEPAKKLYAALGFKVFGTEKRALKLADNNYLDEEHMVLFL